MNGNGRWVLVVYREEPQTSDLLPELASSLERARDFYDQDNYDIVVRNVLPSEGSFDIDFVVKDRRTGQEIAEIEFQPNGYKPIPLDEALGEVRKLGCKIERSND